MQYSDEALAPYELAYRVIRYLEERYPGLIRRLFDEECRGSDFEERIGQALHIEGKDFRKRLVDLTAAYFT